MNRETDAPGNHPCAAPGGQHPSPIQGLDGVSTWLRSFGPALRGAAETMPLRFSLVAVFVLEAFVVAFFQPAYDTIDDVLFTMVASGKGIALAPDQHLVFTNILIGDVLKWLYTAAPAFPWYGLYLLSIHFVAQVAILYCALTIGPQGAYRRTGVRLGIYLMCFGIVELQLLTRLQFTTTSFLAAMAGVFLLIWTGRRRALSAKARVLGPLLAACGLLAISGLVRLESLAMTLLVASPLVLLFLTSARPRVYLPCGLAVVVVVVLMGAAHIYDKSAYEQDPLWHGYRSLNQLRGNFHDSSLTFYSPATAPIFSAAGWSENDHAMIARWFSDETSLYSPDTLSEIMQAYPWRASQDLSFLAWDAFRDIARNRTVLATLLALPFVLMLIPTDMRARLTVLAPLLALAPLLLFVAWMMKVPPERVYLPIVSFPLWAALTSFAWSPASDECPQPFSITRWVKSWWIWAAWRRLPTRWEIATTMLIVAVVMAGVHHGRQTIRIVDARSNLHRIVNDIRSDGYRACVMWEAALPLNVVSPLDTLDEWDHLPLLSIAWPQRTPWQLDIKRQLDITDVATALVNRRDLVLIATDTHREIFQKYVREHYRADIAFEPRRSYGSQLVAGRFLLQDSVRETASRPSGSTIK